MSPSVVAVIPAGLNIPTIIRRSPSKEMEGALVRLADERLITRGVPIQDLPGRWVLWGAAVPLRC